MVHKELTQEQQVGRWINRLRFKSNVWEEGPYLGVSSYIIDTVIKIRRVCGITPPENSYQDEIALIEDGLQYCRIYAKNYEDALNEFKALIWGDW